MNTDILLRTEHLSFSYVPDKPVFSDLSAELPKGVIGLMGPSGCGKSTFLDLICGHLKPTGGKILLPGPETTFSYDMQEDTLLPWMSVTDNLNLLQKGRSSRESISEWLDFVSLSADEVSESYPAELSGGMKKRVQLARTLSCLADIFLFDEPFTGLDKPLKQQLLPRLKRYFTDKSLNVIIVSHDKEDLSFLCDRIFEWTNTDNGVSLAPVP